LFVHRKSDVAAVLVFTDGQANHGVTDRFAMSFVTFLPLNLV
jgi:hypothetical protein